MDPATPCSMALQATFNTALDRIRSLPLLT
jgi:hypothetical protein